MSKECKCEHWQQCPVCMPNRFDKNGHLLPPEPTPLQAARIRIEELEREIERKMSAAAFVLKERDALLADNARLREALKHYAQEDIRNARHYPPEFAKEALAATPEQSLAASELGKERDQLRAQINVLREALSSAESALDESRDYPVTYDEVITALSSTPEQSLAAYRNKVIEECAAVLNVAITRLSSCGASIKNDVAISTLKEQSCRLRAMKEQP